MTLLSLCPHLYNLVLQHSSYKRTVSNPNRAQCSAWCLVMLKADSAVIWQQKP